VVDAIRYNEKDCDPRRYQQDDRHQEIDPGVVPDVEQEDDFHYKRERDPCCSDYEVLHRVLVGDEPSPLEVLGCRKDHDVSPPV